LAEAGAYVGRGLRFPAIQLQSLPTYRMKIIVLPSAGLFAGCRPMAQVETIPMHLQRCDHALTMESEMNDGTFEKVQRSDTPMYGPKKLLLCGFPAEARRLSSYDK
jgi:hypothetical protein